MTGIQIETVDVSPSIAEEWLALNIEHNRRVAEWKIEQYANDMREGRWVPTSATIKFDTHGRLVDGQHRLLAVIESERTVEMMISRNEPDESVLVIDTGLARTSAHSLTVANVVPSGSAVAVSATAAVLYRIENGYFRNAMSSTLRGERLTNKEMIDYVRPRVDEILEANRISYGVYRVLPIPRSVLAASFIILSRVDREAAEEFFTRLQDGTSEGTGDPLLTLTRRVAGDKMSGKQVSQSMALYMLFRTWNAWRDGEKMNKILLGSAASGWAHIPLPH